MVITIINVLMDDKCVNIIIITDKNVSMKIRKIIASYMSFQNSLCPQFIL